jgi:hypothetical protein
MLIHGVVRGIVFLRPLKDQEKQRHDRKTENIMHIEIHGDESVKEK